MRYCRASVAIVVAVTVLVGGGADRAGAETVIRAVMHSDLKILDPIPTTAYISRDHGYMVYDTLVAMDAAQQPQPQRLDRWELSSDKLSYTFTLRDGLNWHDGTPVTAEDCVASIRRWGQRDVMGQKLMTVVKSMAPIDAKTFRLTLTEPYGLVIMSLPSWIRIEPCA